MKLAAMAGVMRDVRSFFYERYGKPEAGHEVEDKKVYQVILTLEDLIEMMKIDAAVRASERQKKVLTEVMEMDEEVA